MGEIDWSVEGRDPHLDVDTLDSDEAALALGQVSGGLTRVRVRRVVAEFAADGLTISEYIVPATY